MDDNESDVAPLRPSDLDGSQVSDEVRTKIGELVNRWAYVEFQLKVVIRESLNITRAVQNLLLHARDVRHLCEFMRQIAEAGDLWVRDPLLREEMVKLSKKIAEGYAIRNDYAHGVFAVPRKGNHPRTFSRLLYQKLEHKIEPGWQPTSVNNLEPLIKKAQQLGTRTQNVTVRIKELKKAGAHGGRR